MEREKLSRRRNIQSPRDLEANILEDGWNDNINIDRAEPTPIKRFTEQVKTKIEKFVVWVQGEL